MLRGTYDALMSADLVVRNLAGGHTHRTLFESLDLTVAPGDVVGVVGANGAGKTTLLRILAGDLEPLHGSVSTAPADAFVGWLPQEHERVPGETVGHYVARLLDIIDKSGLPYRLGPLGTCLEGEYGEVMAVIGSIREAGLARVGLVTEPPADRSR